MKKTLEIIGLILFITLISCGDNPNTKIENRKWDLWKITQIQVKKQLKSPASANFHLHNSIDETVSIYQINGNDTIYNIKGTVDSQNSFGALLTSDFECKLSVSNNEIYLKSLDLK